jgi:hypothetical protein
VAVSWLTKAWGFLVFKLLAWLKFLLGMQEKILRVIQWRKVAIKKAGGGEYCQIQ